MIGCVRWRNNVTWSHLLITVRSKQSLAWVHPENWQDIPRLLKWWNISTIESRHNKLQDHGWIRKRSVLLLLHDTCGTCCGWSHDPWDLSPEHEVWLWFNYPLPSLCVPALSVSALCSGHRDKNEPRTYWHIEKTERYFYTSSISLIRKSLSFLKDHNLVQVRADLAPP